MEEESLDKQFYDLNGKLYDIGAISVRASPPGRPQPKILSWWSKCDDERKRQQIQYLQAEVDKVGVDNLKNLAVND